jgi:hypothetical protein
MVGLDAFLACSEALALKYGNRFAAPLLLQRMYKDGSRFY